jgi:hypothetical protein
VLPCSRPLAQIGFPVLSVEETAEGLRLRQNRFLSTGDPKVSFPGDFKRLLILEADQRPNSLTRTRASGPSRSTSSSSAPTFPPRRSSCRLGSWFSLSLKVFTNSTQRLRAHVRPRCSLFHFWPYLTAALPQSESHTHLHTSPNSLQKPASPNRTSHLPTGSSSASPGSEARR